MARGCYLLSNKNVKLTEVDTCIGRVWVCLLNKISKQNETFIILLSQKLALEGHSAE